MNNPELKNLEHWEELFRERFDNLKRKRDFLKSDCPIFGLEHGLSLAQREEFKDSLCEYLKHCETIAGFPLSWVVYASEIGYDYSGNEYWQTFESKTPGWSRLEDRHLIRDCFLKFHEDYAAAKPEGRWAQHRTIISWPIAHAILPIDLQREMAKTLYDIQHYITSEILANPKSLGELIHAHSFDSKDRFQQITEQYLLIGQIASALLAHGDGDGRNLIDDATLERLVGDLEREQTARVWMADVRRSTSRKRGSGAGGPPRISCCPGRGDPEDPATRNRHRVNDSLSSFLIAIVNEISGNSTQTSQLDSEAGRRISRGSRSRESLLLCRLSDTAPAA
jgi:hypothetical protein